MHTPHTIKPESDTLALAFRIATEASRSDIETNCVSESLGNLTWYDTTNVPGAYPELLEGLATSMHFLHLVNAIIVHPTQPQLVRFPQVVE